MSTSLNLKPRPALVLMDYQPDLLGSLPDADAVLANASRARAAAHAAAIPAIHVSVSFRPDYPELAGGNKAFSPLRGSGALLDAAPGEAFHADLRPEPGDFSVTKRRVSALSETDLPTLLRSLEIDTLVLAGIYTSGAVLSTTRAAADLDYRLIVLSDCCADPDAELHDVLIEKVLSSQADILTVAQLPSTLSGAPA